VDNRVSVTIRILIETEHDLGAANQDRPPDQIGLFHHQIDGFLFRLRQRAGLEHRTACADEIEEPRRVDVLFEKGPIRRIAVDVALFDLGLVLRQKTSGVPARRSCGLEIEDGFRHKRHCTSGPTYN
jgi:hypothetical protein